jgi:hypothetical protein
MTDLVANILATVHTATATETAEGMAWYFEANAAAQALAEEHGVSVECAAGVIAAISPRLAWSVNVDYASRIFATGDAPLLFSNKAKGVEIAGGEAPMIVFNRKPKSGAKVRSFFSNIADPASSQAVTVDRHAFDVAMGAVGDDKTRKALDRVGTYDTITDAYRSAAEVLGILPHQVQAIAWVVWRNAKPAAVAA